MQIASRSSGYLLAFSCKRRHFCPSCHQKRVVEYSEWLLGNVLKEVPHCQWVLSIPKRLRIYFLYDRKLQSRLSKYAWKVIREYHKSASPDGIATPGASIAIDTYGDFLNFNPHIHAIVPDGTMKGWAVNWRSRGWMRTKTEKAKNADLWEELLALCERHNVQFRWVKGHAGVEENERCDFLVNREQAKADLPADEVYEKEIAGRR